MIGWANVQLTAGLGIVSELSVLCELRLTHGAAYETSTAAAAVEMVCLSSLHRAAELAPSHAKAQLRWGNWCYKHGLQMLKALAARPPSLTAEEADRVREFIDENMLAEMAAAPHVMAQLRALLFLCFLGPRALLPAHESDQRC